MYLFDVDGGAVILITIYIEFTAPETAEGNFLAKVLILDPP